MIVAQTANGSWLLIAESGEIVGRYSTDAEAWRAYDREVRWIAERETREPISPAEAIG